MGMKKQDDVVANYSAIQAEGETVISIPFKSLAVSFVLVCSLFLFVAVVVIESGRQLLLTALAELFKGNALIFLRVGRAHAMCVCD